MDTVTPDILIALHDLCKSLEPSGCQKLTVVFSGGGDSGQIDDLVYQPESSQQPGDTIRKKADALLDTLNSCCHYNWWDNDGGSGTLVIDVLAWSWTFNVTVYESEVVSEDDDEPQYETTSIDCPEHSGTLNKEHVAEALLSKSYNDRAGLIGILNTVMRDVVAREPVSEQSKDPEAEAPDSASVGPPKAQEALPPGQRRR